MQFCICDCHKAWCSTVPPKCTCYCWKSEMGQPIQPLINPYETLQLCKHMRPIKYGCTKCYFENYKEEDKVEEIKISNVENKSDIQILLERIENLEQKEHIKVDIESFAFAFNDTMDKYDKKLTALQENLSNLINFPNVAWQKYNKTPHTCPVCNGWGQQQYCATDELKPNIVECNGCKGSGVLWG